MDFRPSFDWHTQLWRWMNLAKSLCLSNTNYPWVLLLWQISTRMGIFRGIVQSIQAHWSVPFSLKCRCKNENCQCCTFWRWIWKTLNLFFENWHVPSFLGSVWCLILQNLERNIDFTKITLVPRGLLKSDTIFLSWICMMLILQNLEQDMDFTKVTLVPRGLLKSDTTFVFQYDPY